MGDARAWSPIIADPGTVIQRMIADAEMLPVSSPYLGGLWEILETQRDLTTCLRRIPLLAMGDGAWWKQSREGQEADYWLAIVNSQDRPRPKD